jgi:hypothetical protein
LRGRELEVPATSFSLFGCDTSIGIIVPAISWSELLFCYRHIVSSFVKNSGGVDYSVIQTGSLLFFKKKREKRWTLGSVVRLQLKNELGCEHLYIAKH